MTQGNGEKRGRKRKDAADVIRAKACWKWVASRTGLSSEGIENLLAADAESATVTDRPHKWDRYRRGEMCPRDDGTEFGTVGIVERNLPGFRAFHGNPFWTAIREGTLGIPQIEAEITRTSVFNELQMATGCYLTTGGLLARLRQFDSAIEVALVSAPTLDSLAVFLLLAHDSYLLGSIDQTSICLIGYRWHVPMLRQMVEFQGLSDDLTDLMDKRLEQIYRAQGNQNVSLRTKSLSDEQLLFLEEC